MTTRTNALIIFGILTGLAACGPDGGEDPVVTGKTAPDGGHAMIADASSSTSAVQFLGKWTYVSGNYTLACDGQPVLPTPATGTVSFTAGDGPDEIVASDGMGCDIPCTVASNVATAHPGYVCPGDLAVESLVYTLKDGALREQSSGNAPIQGQLCDVSDDAMLAHD